jgi:hypothetical protein
MNGRKMGVSVASAAVFAGALLAAMGAGRADDTAENPAGEAAFGDVALVLLSPRCRNCHPSGDAPLQGEAHPKPHAMNLRRASPKAGLGCAACHRESNDPHLGGPPGAHGWALPPDAMPMIFEGRSPKQLCLQLKDPKMTGGRDLAAIREHVASDALVRWAWAPGPGRATPKITQAALLKSLDAWIALGAPCPR